MKKWRPRHAQGIHLKPAAELSKEVGPPQVFLLGAGFNCDATCEAGQTTPFPSGRPPRYPLVSDLLDICFGLDALPPDKSVEDLFQDSINNRDRRPLEVLYEALMEADYYITPHLRRGGSHADNIYRKFLRAFPNAPLLTFNYDSLPEILLLAERAWSPFDGYGVQVKAETKTIRRGRQPLKVSLRPILHLHGSLCVYPGTFYIEKGMLKFDQPADFLFDPDRIGRCFYPFERITPSVTYTHVSNRVIAPVLNKAKGLNGVFIKAVYDQATRFLSAAGQIISIGYSFNRHDMLSYRQLLSAASKKDILLVAPEAKTLITHLSNEYHDNRWVAQNMSFKEWVNNGYPGVFDKT